VSAYDEHTPSPPFISIGGIVVLTHLGSKKVIDVVNLDLHLLRPWYAPL
jgi:hypothetical protein